MGTDEPSLEQRISILRFRNLTKSLETESSNLYQDSSVFVDDDRNVFFKLQKKGRHAFNVFYARIKKSVNPLTFIIELGLYIIGRVRVVTVIFSVISAVFSEAFDSFRKGIIKNLFWGRGNLFRFTAQILAAFFIIVIMLSFSYNLNPIVSEVPVVNASSQDLLKQQSVSTTAGASSLSTSETKYYVVKAGDTLSRIAQKYQVDVDTIMWANSLSSAHYISPGMKLIIPPGNGILVTAKKGDTLVSIAKKYKVDSQALLDDNTFLITADDLKSGDVLFVRDAQPIQTIATKPSYSNVIITKPFNNIPSSPRINGVGRFLSWPVAGGRGTLTQCFWPGGHNGIDIADGSMPSLVAAASGTVTFAGCQSGSCPAPGQIYGGSGLAWTVIIDHGNGLSTVYGHMSSIGVRSGQHVSAGQVIGRMGASGRVTGIHVHFMVLSGGGWNWVNPSAYMSRHICGY